MTEQPGTLSRLATAAARRPVVALVAWGLALGVAGALALGGVGGDTLFQRLKSEAPTAAGQASEGSGILAGDGGATESLTLVAHGIDPQDATAAGETAALAQRAADLPHTELVDPLAVPRLPDGSVVPALAPLIADDGDGFLLTGTVSGVDGADPDPATVDELLAELTTTADALRADFPDATVEVGGGTLLVDSIVHMSEQDLQRGETVALPIALLVMLLVFGGFIAAGIPLVGAMAAIIGGLFSKYIKYYLFNPWIVCATLVAGGIVLLVLDETELEVKKTDVYDFSLPMALKIGIFQCLAMIPGVSRSGATIIGALLMGASKRAAAEFSFFLSMPTMAGAFAYDLYKNRGILDAAALGNVAIGFVCAFITAIFVVR